MVEYIVEVLLSGKVVEYIGVELLGKVLLSGKVVEYIVELLLEGKVLPFTKGVRVYSRGAA